MKQSIWEYLPTILGALPSTITLVLVSLVVSTLLAAILTPIAVSNNRWLKTPVGLYSWLGRALPPLTLLIFVFYGLSYAGIQVPGMTAAIVAFILFATAYNLEIFRAGYLAVPKTQFDAARALGVPAFSAQLKIIAPQVMRVSAPAYLTNATVVLKDSSLASVIGVVEITAQTQRITQSDPGSAVTLYAVLALIYLALSSVLLGLQQYLDKRMQRTS